MRKVFHGARPDGGSQPISRKPWFRAKPSEGGTFSLRFVSFLTVRLTIPKCIPSNIDRGAYAPTVHLPQWPRYDLLRFGTAPVTGKFSKSSMLTGLGTASQLKYRSTRLVDEVLPVQLFALLAPEGRDDHCTVTTALITPVSGLIQEGNSAGTSSKAAW